MAAAKVTAAQARAAKQKKIIIAGGALLVVVLFIQVPRMMKQLNSESAAPAPAPVVTPPAGVVPTPVAPTAPVAVASGKLVSFERFGSKDPFVQQVTAGGGAAAGEDQTAAPTGGPEQGAAGGSVSQPTAFKSSGTSSATNGPRTATIQVNGTTQTVAASKTFPKSDPVFKLVSVTEGSAEIAIADGSFKSGDSTIRLTEGKALTLLNTADGKRYKLLLVSTSG